MGRVDKILRDHPAFAVGADAAEEEIAFGKLGYQEHGKLASWWRDAAAILQERYGIAFTVVGACITEMDIAAKAAGYNERMEVEFQSRFGADVIDSVFREVERKRKKGK